ncbi:MAG: hypothetical protein IIA06_06320 [Proteobacteria bacterium]|nr:hypothetical protein [Pseudomonadota bacterium]
MKFKMMLVLLALVVPTFVNALGLGKLELQSALNQPFKARVELVSATADELDSLKVSLADQKAFDRAGIQRTFLLTRLRFTVQEFEEGPDYIQISSSDPIREPFLNFLLEINWSKGRLFREYTVLLDPPTYTASKKAVVHPQSPVVEIDSDDHLVVYDLDYKPSTTEPARTTSAYETPTYEAPTISYSGSGDYGPAVSGDTLWSIARVARLDSSVSIQQMMLAILRANPEAFIENNINGLKRGAILQMPDAPEINSLNRTNALAQAKSQNALWDEYKGRIASTVTERPDGAGAPGQVIEPDEAEHEPSVTDVEVTDEAELRLISESDQGLGSGQSSMDAPGVDVDSLNNQLVLANESIVALTMENEELRDRLTQTEGIIDDLKRLIVLKEDELAAMQEQIMIAAVEQESAEEAGTETVAEEELVEEEAKEDLVEEETEALGSEDAIEEEIFVDVTLADSGGLGDLFGLMGLLEKAKANLMIIAGAVGGLLLLVFLMLFVSKKRGEKATTVVLPAEDFPDFGEDVSDETVKADALPEKDSESVTVIPGSEDETILPGDEEASDADAFEIPEEGAPEIPEETGPAVAEEPEEDPMEEVNVFLAYEHFDEAESFVRNALQKEPDNLSFHTKLLEVFYAASNKKSYEEAAREVYDKTGGQGEYWDMVTGMWQEMSPNRALFETPVEGEDEEASKDDSVAGVLNIADDSDAAASGDTDLDIGADAPGEDMLDVTAAADIDDIPAETAEDEGLDFTLDADTPGEDMLDVTAAADKEEMLDVTAAADIDDIPAETAEDEGLDFTLDAGGEPGISADESDELLDSTVQMQPGDVEQVVDDLLDVTAAIDLEEGMTDAGDEELPALSTSVESVGSDELDLSLGEASLDLDSSVDTEATESVDELEISLDESLADSAGELDTSLDESLADSAGELEISLDESLADSAGELDTSLDESLADSASELDISLDDDAELLDSSVDSEVADSEVAESVVDLDLSLGEPLDDDAKLLDSSVDTEATESAGELDLSLDDSGAVEDSIDDLLDVTSKIDFESEGDEDLLDVTAAAVRTGIDDSDLMELDSADADAVQDASDEIDLDLGDESPDISLKDDLTGDSIGEDSADLDFDLGTDDGDTTGAVDLELDTPDLEIAADTGADADDLSLDMEVTVEMPAASMDKLDLGTDDGDTTGSVDLELDTPDLEIAADTGADADDLSLDMDATVEIPAASMDKLDLGTDDGDTAGAVDLELDTPDLEIAADTGTDADDLSLDMDATVEIPAASMDKLDLADNDEDDDDDKTFLVPKSSDVAEQSADDEMASQLDLAKAYIELGDNENAKTILDEIIAQGSDAFRKQAEELIGQIN